MQDPAYQPQPDPKDNRRRTDAEKGGQSLLAPDALRAIELTNRDDDVLSEPTKSADPRPDKSAAKTPARD